MQLAPSNTELYRGLFLVSLLVGLALVLAALWQVSPALPAAQVPLETRFRSEVLELTSKPGTLACKYYPKLLQLSCAVSEVSRDSLERNLKLRGWGSTQPAGLQTTFSREHDVLDADCRGSSQAFCDITLRRRLTPATHP